jgi:hypothetical protein
MHGSEKPRPFEYSSLVMGSRDIPSVTFPQKRPMIAPTKTYEKIAIVLPWDKKTFLERNEIRNSNEGKHISLDVWENFCNIYQKPTFEEGFDKIIIL